MQCEHCGKQIETGVTVYTFPSEIAEMYGDEIMFRTGGVAFEPSDCAEQNEEHFVCNECYEKLNYDKYFKEVEKLVKSFTKKMTSLNIKYIKGEL